MPAPAKINSVSTGRTLRIIYADDLINLREVARLALTRDGHTIECVENGAIALEKISAAPTAYDLILTDHHMPVMNGLELVAALRSLPISTKIIVFSSELSPKVGAAYLALGVSSILPKPIFPSELRRALSELFPLAPSAR